MTGIIGLISAWRPAHGTRRFGIVWKDANTLKPPVAIGALHCANGPHKDDKILSYIILRLILIINAVVSNNCAIKRMVSSYEIARIFFTKN